VWWCQLQLVMYNCLFFFLNDRAVLLLPLKNGGFDSCEIVLELQYYTGN
jgi:hypothetical protein